jgi:hypothetical protein
MRISPVRPSASPAGDVRYGATARLAFAAESAPMPQVIIIVLNDASITEQPGVKRR